MKKYVCLLLVLSFNTYAGAISSLKECIINPESFDESLPIASLKFLKEDGSNETIKRVNILPVVNSDGVESATGKYDFNYKEGCKDIVELYKDSLVVDVDCSPEKAISSLTLCSGADDRALPVRDENYMSDIEATCKLEGCSASSGTIAKDTFAVAYKVLASMKVSDSDFFISKETLNSLGSYDDYLYSIAQKELDDTVSKIENEQMFSATLSLTKDTALSFTSFIKGWSTDASAYTLDNLQVQILANQDLTKSGTEDFSSDHRVKAINELKTCLAHGIAGAEEVKPLFEFAPPRPPGYSNCTLTSMCERTIGAYGLRKVLDLITSDKPNSIFDHLDVVYSGGMLNCTPKQIDGVEQLVSNLNKKVDNLKLETEQLNIALMFNYDKRSTLEKKEYESAMMMEDQAMKMAVLKEEQAKIQNEVDSLQKEVNYLESELTKYKLGLVEDKEKVQKFVSILQPIITSMKDFENLAIATKEEIANLEQAAMELEKSSAITKEKLAYNQALAKEIEVIKSELNAVNKEYDAMLFDLNSAITAGKCGDADCTKEKLQVAEYEAVKASNLEKISKYDAELEQIALNIKAANEQLMANDTAHKELVAEFENQQMLLEKYHYELKVANDEFYKTDELFISYFGSFQNPYLGKNLDAYYASQINHPEILESAIDEAFKQSEVMMLEVYAKYEFEIDYLLGIKASFQSDLDYIAAKVQLEQEQFSKLAKAANLVAVEMGIVQKDIASQEMSIDMFKTQISETLNLIEGLSTKACIPFKSDELINNSDHDCSSGAKA